MQCRRRTRGAALLGLLCLTTPRAARGSPQEVCAARAGARGGDGAALLQSRAFASSGPLRRGVTGAAAGPVPVGATARARGGAARAGGAAALIDVSGGVSGLAFLAGAEAVRLAVRGLVASQNATATEISELITKFINSQAASTDKCPAQLMEAKHQLNDLHIHIGDLVTKVSATEKLVQVADGSLREKLEEIRQADLWRDKAIANCDAKRAEDTKMWLVLKEEMREMQQIARPEASMSITGKTVGSFKPLLLQVDGIRPEAEVSEVQRLVQSTKDVAASVAACVQHSRRQAHGHEALIGLHGWDRVAGAGSRASPLTKTCVRSSSGSIFAKNTKGYRIPGGHVCMSLAGGNCQHDQIFGHMGITSQSDKDCIKFHCSGHCGLCKEKGFSVGDTLVAPTGCLSVQAQKIVSFQKKYPHSKIPNPLQPRGGTCVYGLQCETNFCCPKLKLCLLDSSDGKAFSLAPKWARAIAGNGGACPGAFGPGGVKPECTCYANGFPDAAFDQTKCGCKAKFMSRFNANTWVPSEPGAAPAGQGTGRATTSATRTTTSATSTNADPLERLLRRLREEEGEEEDDEEAEPATQSTTAPSSHDAATAEPATTSITVPSDDDVATAAGADSEPAASHFPASGSGSAPLEAQLVIAMNFSQIESDLDAFRALTRQSLAAACGIPEERIVIESVTAGSIVVDFQIGGAADGPAPAEVLADIQEQLTDADSSLMTGDYAAYAKRAEAKASPAGKKLHKGGGGGGFSNCSARAILEVTVGNLSEPYAVPRDIADGHHAPYPCEEVNPSFRGTFWVKCDKGVLAADVGQCLHRGSSPEECSEQKEKLEKTYVKTYVELARLVAEFEDLANSTACHDSVQDRYNTRKAPLTSAAAELTEEMMQHIQALQSLRPQLSDTKDAYGMLAKQIDELKEKCAALPKTISDLHQVRDAIHALALCPGLERAEFVIPKWVGRWAVVDDVDGRTMSDEEIDDALNLACDKAFAGQGRKVRAAGTAEIEAVSIEGVPRNNTAGQPVIGTCPHCAGELDGERTPKHRAGHARICWDPEAKLGAASKRTDCSSGSKAVLCVYERGNIRALNLTMPTVPTSADAATQEPVDFVETGAT